jgi:hypothetical protein
MATKTKDCKPPRYWQWEDCDKDGHEEESCCFMLVCLNCGYKDRDCEE